MSSEAGLTMLYSVLSVGSKRREVVYFSTVASGISKQTGQKFER